MPKRIVMSKELSQALAQVMDHLHKNPGQARLDGTELHIECAFKYIRVWFSWTVLVVLPNGDAFEPLNSGDGRLPNWNRPVGNIIELVKRRNWQRLVRFRVGTANYPEAILLGQPAASAECQVCHRSAGVRATAVGLRCSYHRGADVRHMNDVRQLGGMPRVGRRALKTDADYYRVKR